MKNCRSGEQKITGGERNKKKTRKALVKSLGRGMGKGSGRGEI